MPQSMKARTLRRSAEATRTLRDQVGQKELHHHHNKQCGIRWEELTSYIEESVMGRKLTQAELNRFVGKNILTINRKRQ